MSSCQTSQTSLGKQSLARERCKHHRPEWHDPSNYLSALDCGPAPHREGGCRLTAQHTNTHGRETPSPPPPRYGISLSITFIFGKVWLLCCRFLSAFDLVSPVRLHFLFMSLSSPHRKRSQLSTSSFVQKQLTPVLFCQPSFSPRPLTWIIPISSLLLCLLLFFALPICWHSPLPHFLCYIRFSFFFSLTPLQIRRCVFSSYMVISLQISAVSGRVLPSCLDHSALICETAEMLRTAAHASLEWIYVLREA